MNKYIFIFITNWAMNIWIILVFDVLNYPRFEVEITQAKRIYELYEMKFMACMQTVPLFMKPKENSS